jgi:hypothetical protein
MQGIVATVEHSGCQGGGCGGGNHLDRLALGMKPERGSVTSRIANFETNPSQGTKTHHINPLFLSPSIFAVTLVPSLLSQQPNIFEIGTCKQHTHALPPNFLTSLGPNYYPALSHPYPLLHSRPHDSCEQSDTSRIETKQRSSDRKTYSLMFEMSLIPSCFPTAPIKSNPILGGSLHREFKSYFLFARPRRYA